MAVDLAVNALATVDDVKQILAGGGHATISSAPDPIIISLINLFSSAVETTYCDRILTLEEHTEFHDGGRSVIALSAPPISYVDGRPQVDVYEDTEHEWGDDTLLTLGSHYDVVSRKSGAQIVSLGSPFVCGRRTLKIVYHGGLVVPGDPTSAPPDLRIACAMQVAHWYQRRSDMGIDLISVPGGGTIRVSEPSQLLKQVAVILNAYKQNGTEW